MLEVPREGRDTRPHRPWLAALLSFLFPGLGHAYAGRYPMAVAFAAPVLLLLVVAAAIIGGRVGDLGNSLLSSGFLTAVLVLNGVLLFWRAAAIAHAGLVPMPELPRARREAIGAVVAGVALTVVMHAWIGAVIVQLEDTLAQVFSGQRVPDPEEPSSTGDPGSGDDDDDDDPGQVISEPDYEWDGEERINILMIGTDAAPGRDDVLTDVVLVVSVDPVDETAVMVSVPRDTGFVPLPDTRLYDDGLYPGKVNGLMARATRNAELWCPDLMEEESDPSACGIRTLRRSIGLYLGIEIHYYALVDMQGFAQMIDAMGGVELCLQGRLVDPDFGNPLEDEAGRDGLTLPEGCHEYNGAEALAYARSRQGYMEMPDGERVQQTDFHRNERQQRVLLAMRRELAKADTFFELPALLGAMSRTVSTDFPRDRAGDLASLLPLITGPDIERLVLGHPEYVDLPARPLVNYILTPKRDAIRDRMAEVFGADNLEGWYLETDAPTPDVPSDAAAGAEPAPP